MAFWSDEEVTKLVSLREEGYTYKEIGKVLGRSTGACKDKVRSMKPERKEYCKKYCEENKDKRKEYSKKYREEHKEYYKEKRKKHYEDNKEYYKEYNKKRYEENKEYYKEKNKKYREEHKEYFKEYKKKYYEENKDRIKEYGKKYRENNKDRIKEKNKKYYEDNKDKRKEYSKKYREDNKEYFKKYHHYRYQKKINQLINQGYNFDNIDKIAPHHRIRVMETNNKYLDYLIFDKPISDYSGKKEAYYLHHIIPYSLCMAFNDINMACDPINNRLILTYEEHQEIHSILNEKGLNPRTTDEIDYDVYIKVHQEWLDGYYDRIGQTNLDNFKNDND